jgi:hypothetical protein
VLLQVFNLSGQLIATLVNEENAGGSYSVNWNAENLNAGVYNLVLKSGEMIEIKKAILVK